MPVKHRQQQANPGQTIHQANPVRIIKIAVQQVFAYLSLLLINERQKFLIDMDGFQTQN